MMSLLRKLLLVGVSIAVVLGAVLIYRWFSGPPSQSSPEVVPRLPDGINNLEDIKEIDPDGPNLRRGEKLELRWRGPGGVIEREYYAQRFWLEAEDRAALEEVRLVWHLKGGQSLTLTADTGQIQIERGPVGRLQPIGGNLSGNVRIVLDRNPEQEKSPPVLGERDSQELLITTGDLDFDTRSCRLWTDDAVQLQGAELEAYGTGFQLRWREVSREIDQMVITQGGELIWRGSKAEDIAQAGRPQEQASSSKTVEEPGRVHSYLASFERDVRVTYDSQILDNVDRLNILFDMTVPEESTGSDEEAGDPAKVGSVKADRPDEAEVRPVLRLTWKGRLTVVPAEAWQADDDPARRFQVQAMGQPVTFQSRQMSGSCAKLQAERHARIAGQPQGETVTVRMFNGPGTDVVLRPSKETTIVAEEALMDTRIGQARMKGKGKVTTTEAVASESQKARPTELSWQGEATLLFGRQNKAGAESDSQAKATDNFYISAATARKQVVLVSDQILAKADLVNLKLGLPGSDGTRQGQEVQLLEARDNFSSELDDGKLKISADSMKAQFSRSASGKGQFVSSIDLAGSVLAKHQQAGEKGHGELRSELLHLDLEEDKDVTPSSTSGYISSQVSRMQADKNVIGRYMVEGKPTSTLEADRLVREEGTRTTFLYGGPAKLTKGENSLESNRIQVTQQKEGYLLSTPGPGQMQASFGTSEQGAEKAVMGLQWPGTMEFNGPANTAVFKGLGQQRVTGAVVHNQWRWSKLEGQNLTLYLSDTEDPTTRKANISAGSSADLVSTETFFKPMGGRVLREMVLTGKAQVRNVEEAAGQEKRLRSVLLESQVLSYEAQRKEFSGKGLGRMLLEDYRPTDTKVQADEKLPPSGQPPRRESRRLGFERTGPGVTGFWWTESAHYGQADRRAKLVGDVHMVSMGYGLTLPDGSATKPEAAAGNRQRTELWSQAFTITFAEPQPGRDGPKQSGFADLSGVEEMQVQRLEAEGQASLISADVHIEGPKKITYDTKLSNIEIEGSRRSPASLTYFDRDKGQWMRWTGQRVQYDTAHRQGQAPGGKFEFLTE